MSTELPPAAGTKALPAPGVSASFWSKPSAWEELALTLPVFLVYHLGVVFLGIQNATDFLTRGMMMAADGSTSRYLGITALLGAILVAVFAVLGRGNSFRTGKFVQIACEGAFYAFVGRFLAAYVVGKLLAIGGTSSVAETGRFAGLIMSLGAGFYEEVAFRVLLFGLGVKFLVWFWKGQVLTLVGTGSFKDVSRSLLIIATWALISGILFSGMHYVGELSDPFQLKSFLFRLLLGLFFTLVYITRGFAAVVWTHALYDIWVLVLH
jgi:Type II CAAX prenyl endopeptidase Rce1-like